MPPVTRKILHLMPTVPRKRGLYGGGGGERRLRAGYTQTVGAVCVLLFSMLVLYDLHLIWKHGWLINNVGVVQIFPGVVILFVILCLAASDLSVKNRDKAKKHAEAAREHAEAVGNNAEERAKPDRKAAPEVS